MNVFEIYHDLKETMDDAAAEKIAAHLGRLSDELRSLPNRKDFFDLRGGIRELADAQTRTEETVETLADAQTRTEQKVEALADAQMRTEQKVEALADAQTRTEQKVEALVNAQTRTEQKVEALAIAQENLANAQTRTEQKVEALANAQTRTESAIQELIAAHKDLEKSHQRLAQQVGGLSDAIGGDIEDIAYSLIFRVLSDTFDWQIGDLGRVWHTWDKAPEEVNIFGKAADLARPEVTIWIIGEAKHNLTLKELRKFQKQLERARRHLQGEIFPICFCCRARPEVQQTAQQTGIYLLFSYGKLLYPAA